MPRFALAPSFARSARLAAAARPALLAATAALVAACGGGDTLTGTSGDPAAQGTFSGSVAGGVSRAITGVAFWAQSATGAGNAAAFQVAMGSLNAGKTAFQDMVAVSRATRDVPAAGTYPLFDATGEADPSADQFVLVAVMAGSGGQSLVCAGTGGTLTVQSTSGGHVKGSYTAPARCVDAANPTAEVAVTLSGSFDAVGGTQISLPGGARVGAVQAARAGR